MIGDTDLKISKLYGRLPAEVAGTSEGRTAVDNMTVRNVFVVGPDKKIKLVIVYPMSTGRNFDEVLRVIDSLQLTAKYSVATPVNWKDGDDCIIVPAITDEQAKEKFPAGWTTVKLHARYSQPNKLGRIAVGVKSRNASVSLAVVAAPLPPL
jgi:hypothetical protein